MRNSASGWTWVLPLIVVLSLYTYISAAEGPAPPGAEEGVLPGQDAMNEMSGLVELVESVPIETSLDLSGLRNTPEVWVEMIDGARSTIDIETFYFSAGSGNDQLELVLKALEKASSRGVRIRALSDAGFHRTYPEVFGRLEQLSNIETRIIDAGKLWGGVIHAKFFIVDGKELFVGSQNWDWRALEHIHELGVRISHKGLADALEAVFLMDWENSIEGQAGGDPSGKDENVSTNAEPGGAFVLKTESGETVRATLAASPNHALPEGLVWDEPLIRQAIDRAEDRIRFHLLTFNPVDRSGRYHDGLESALRRAAARGVAIQVILSNWSKRDYILPYVLSLAAIPGIDVRFSNIPEWSGGFIPYARVGHPKYMIVDEDVCWIGTSNWTRSDFFQSRNISLFFEGEGVAAKAGAFFDGTWNSEYVEQVDLCGNYLPPKIGRE